MLLHLQKQLENWWRNRNENIISATLRNWLQEAKTRAFSSVIRSLFKSCIKTFVGTGMRFSGSEVSRLQTELSDKRAVHLRSNALALCTILLLDCLDTSKCIFATLKSLQKTQTCYCKFGLVVTGNGLQCSVIQQICKA